MYTDCASHRFMGTLHGTDINKAEGEPPAAGTCHCELLQLGVSWCLLVMHHQGSRGWHPGRERVLVV